MSDGPLTGTVLDYTRTIEALVQDGNGPSDWDRLAEFVAVDQFERIGTFLEVQDWRQYSEMLSHWGSSVDKFETSVRRISELPGLVFFEIEERHFRGDGLHIVNSMTVFEFDERGKIRRLNVYLQQEGAA